MDEENDWRHRPENAYKDGDKAQVSIVSTENRDLKEAVKTSVGIIGGVRKALAPGDRVLLKPNFNSDDPYPASTDLGFLKAVVEILRAAEGGAQILSVHTCAKRKPHPCNAIAR